MTKTLFNTFPTACVSGATRSKVLVAICNFKFKHEVRKQKGLQQNTLSIKLGSREMEKSGLRKCRNPPNLSRIMFLLVTKTSIEVG